MAGGKLSPRQKMINLMYLVFIAMLALNMSKEVLSAFGLMNEKFEGVNKFSEEYNGSLYGQLESKAGENSAQFGEPFQKAKQVKPVVQEFYNYVENLKKDITKDIEKEENGKLPYESMDKGDQIDEAWFSGDGYSAKGNEIIGAFDKFKKGLIAVVGNDVKYKFIVDDINAKFNTGDVKDGEGITKKYLDYHFKGFPAIASLTKLSAIQSDIKKTEQDIYNALIGNTTAKAASMKNYKAIVITEKSAFFAGEAVKGKVVLGRYDKSTVPTAVTINGSAVNLGTALEDGQVNFSFGSGNVGEHDITGKFTFIEDGKPVDIPVEGNYVVVPRPNSANISADKMNVVYRGLPNPMTISFAGISDDKVSASAPGLTRASKPGTYNLNPGSGTEVTVSVTGKLPDGKAVSDKKTFRIKNIPAPIGAIGGEMGVIKGAKSRLEVSQISAKLPDFLYDLNFQVTQFTFKVPGQAAVIVNGDRVNAQCKAALARAGRGDQVTISDIKTKIIGVTANIMTGKTAPVVYEIQ
ncbi:type IX secretion system motor protein PorM/GldM [Flavobacterium saliperosum]|uniref:Gliding motility-associated protein GldM n=2 Tax=Flavobacterium saliperosum TaxID=329186 RepID=A0A1G4V5D0_9FLAO|nr:gliding motility protein GldM [Flavobacterium saliperosum]SCX01417.1 gliding motility-associated protein GldM [Flavobacterium saliperosum]